MIPEMQIIDGKFYTKPPEPEEIPRETVEEWLATAVSTKAQAEANLAAAETSKENTIAQQDATITKHREDVENAEEEISSIEGWLTEIPE